MSRRGRIEIIKDILTVASRKSSVTKTEIVYQANLNFTRIDNYLSLLFNKNLLKRNKENMYLITEDGRDFLKNIKKAFDFL